MTEFFQAFGLAAAVLLALIGGGWLIECWLRRSARLAVRREMDSRVFFGPEIEGGD